MYLVTCNLRYLHGLSLYLDLFHAEAYPLCSEENKYGISVFSTEDVPEDLFTLINRYLPIKVEKDDPFPKTICPGCHIQLEAAKLFMDLIIEGQAKLRTLLKSQQDRFDREEKERQKLEEALQNHNPNATVETYTIQTDESGEKFIIQIFSEGPLFLPEHELTLKAEGLDKPKRKRGRPSKSTSINYDPSPDQPSSETEEKNTHTNKLGTEDKNNEANTERTDSGRRNRRTIKAPARYEGAVQGKELDKILKKEGVIDEDIEDLREERRSKIHVRPENDDEKKLIGKVVTCDGSLEKPVYLNQRSRKIRKYGNYRQKHKYTCDICKREFKHLGRYELHKKSHKIKYACQEKDCKFQNDNRGVILDHQKETEHVGISIVEQITEYNGMVVISEPTGPLDSSTEEIVESISEEKPVQCPTCDKSFACKQNYEVHLKAVHDGEKPHKCGVCQRAFAYACSLKYHALSHIKKESETEIEQFPCDKCDKVFNHPSSLFYHKDTEHGNQRFICNKCDRSFKHRQLLQRHQTVHTKERPFKCSQCPLSFKTRTNLINHENVHKGTKRYICSICGQGFTHKTSLAVHIRWHEGNKPYECDICKKTFSQKGNLIEHKRIHTGEKPFTCDVCGRSFTTSSQWRLHSKRHTGEKPFECEHCHKRFLHKETFETHIRRHLNVRPFKCVYCFKKFAESWACSRHQRLHLGQKPYQCGICDKSFADASNFNKHTKIHLRNGLKRESVEKQDEPEINASSNLQFQELMDAEGNVISLTTSDGRPIPIVSSTNEKIQGLMPDGTLVSFDILPGGQSKAQENDPLEVPTSQEINLINTEIQFLGENSNPSNNMEKPAFLSEDGKVCFIGTFDENSFLTMS